MALVSSLEPGSRILDVGCGTGLPLTRALLSLRFEVVGVDSSARMLEHFRKNCPTGRAILGTIQSCDLEGMPFDAAIAWGVLFHMPHAEQANVLASVSRGLKRGARFLFTSGDENGTIEGAPMNGVPFRYWSFDRTGYERLLDAHGCKLVETHEDAGGNVYYLAEKLR
jgi:SAM-dependent methyltransferase